MLVTPAPCGAASLGGVLRTSSTRYLPRLASGQPRLHHTSSVDCRPDRLEQPASRISSRQVSVQCATRQHLLPQDPAPGGDEVLELNVGGQLMQTTRGTLCHVHGSRLASMFARGAAGGLARDAAGRVWLDYDPLLFHLALRFLRELRMTGAEVVSCLPAVQPADEPAFRRLLLHLGLLPEGRHDTPIPLVLSPEPATEQEPLQLPPHVQQNLHAELGERRRQGLLMLQEGGQQQQQRQRGGGARRREQQGQGRQGQGQGARPSSSVACSSGPSSGGGSSSGSSSSGGGSAATRQDTQQRNPRSSAASTGTSNILPVPHALSAVQSKAGGQGPQQPATERTSASGNTIDRGSSSSSSESASASGSGGASSSSQGAKKGTSGRAPSSGPLRLSPAPVARPTLAVSSLFYISAEHSDARGLRVSVHTEADLPPAPATPPSSFPAPRTPPASAQRSAAPAAPSASRSDTAAGSPRAPNPTPAAPAALPFDMWVDCTYGDSQLSLTFVSRKELPPGGIFLGLTSRAQLDRRGCVIPSYGWKSNGCTYNDHNGGGRLAGGDGDGAASLTARGALDTSSAAAAQPQLPSQHRWQQELQQRRQQAGRGAGGQGAGAQGQDAGSWLEALGGQPAGALPLWRKGDSVELILRQGQLHNQLLLKVNGRHVDVINRLPSFKNWAWYVGLWAGADVSCAVFQKDQYAVYWGDYMVKRFL